MRRALALAVLLVAGCGDSGYGGDSERVAVPQRQEGPHVVNVSKPTPAEREYVNVVGEWVLGAGTIGGGCALDEYAGEPPTERMDELARAAVASCRAGGAKGERLRDAVVTRIAGYELHWGSAQVLPERGGRTRVSRIEPRFSEATRELTGVESEVRCWSDEDWEAVASAGSPFDEDDTGGASELAGFVADDQRIHLAPDVCDDLVELAYGDVRGADAGVAFAVVALAHEARHRMGELREDRTECWALQNARRMATLLGADEELAAELSDLYWEEIYPNQEPPYFSEECRDGGALDVRPESDEWP